MSLLAKWLAKNAPLLDDIGKSRLAELLGKHKQFETSVAAVGHGAETGRGVRGMTYDMDILKAEHALDPQARHLHDEANALNKYLRQQGIYVKPGPNGGLHGDMSELAKADLGYPETGAGGFLTPEGSADWGEKLYPDKLVDLREVAKKRRTRRMLGEDDDDPLSAILGDDE